MQLFALAIGAVVVFGVFYFAAGLRRNIAAAKASGLPYVIGPCSPWFLPWQISQHLWIPVIQLLPKAWWENWLPAATRDYSWVFRHDDFARHGDVFLLVSPGSIIMFVANAEAINQIALRRDHFPKHVDIYQILNQFGRNVLTVEGAAWRAHRRATAASFNERNAALVFRESVHQSLGLLRFWDDKRARSESSTLFTAQEDVMRLALNIIGYVGFGVRLPWPNEKTPDDLDPVSAKYGAAKPPRGFRSCFVEAMGTLLENILTLLLVPRWLIALIPYKRFREAAQSHDDYVKYIDELLRLKIQEVEKGQRAAEGMDLMGQLVRSRYEATKGSGKPLPGVLSLDEIRGNAFIMLVAGHETTANAVHFTLIHLAGNPSSQRRLHHELDRLVGDKEPDTWEYDEMINPLMASLLGAWMNETLRVLPPVIEMPKMVTPDRDQPLVVDSTRYVVPRGTIVSLCAASVHNNPRYWPTKPSRFSPGESDIHEHVPERWILSSEGGGGGGDDGSHGGRVRDRGEDEKKEKEVEVEGADREDYGGFQGRDTSAKLFRPESGAYIPFSFGARACLGRRIAQVEVIAALAVLLREYSVELAVDEWASDEEVARMDRYQKAEVYGRAQARMRKVVRGATSLLTLKLHGEVVPLRIVRRGEERFVNWMDGEGEQE